MSNISFSIIWILLLNTKKAATFLKGIIFAPLLFKDAIQVNLYVN